MGRADLLNAYEKTGLDWREAAANISDYAGSTADGGEFFAEAFANWRRGKWNDWDLTQPHNQWVVPIMKLFNGMPL